MLKVFDVAVDGFNLMHGHAPFNAPVDGARLVLRKIVAGLRAQQNEHFLQRAFGLGCRVQTKQRQLAEGVGDVRNQLGSHLGRWQCEIDHAGCQRTARHAVPLGRLGRLRHHHAASVLNGAHTERAITAGAGEHDANATFALVMRERAKQEINR